VYPKPSHPNWAIHLSLHTSCQTRRAEAIATVPRHSPKSLIHVSVLLANGLIGCFRSTNAASIASAERSG
jgi:hypothetical protein